MINNDKERISVLEEEITKISTDVHCGLADDHAAMTSVRVNYRTKRQLVLKHIRILEKAVKTVNDIRIIYHLETPYVQSTLADYRKMLVLLRELDEAATFTGLCRVLGRHALAWCRSVLARVRRWL